MPLVNGRVMLIAGTLVVAGLLTLRVTLERPRFDVQGGEILAQGVRSRAVIPAGTPVERRDVTLGHKIMGMSTHGYMVGRFNVAGLGLSRVISDGSSQVLDFATRSEPTILSPADPGALLTAWKSGGKGTFRPATHPQVSTYSWLSVAFVIGLAVFRTRHAVPARRA